MRDPFSACPEKYLTLEVRLHILITKKTRTYGPSVLRRSHPAPRGTIAQLTIRFKISKKALKMKKSYFIKFKFYPVCLTKFKYCPMCTGGKVILLHGTDRHPTVLKAYSSIKARFLENPKNWIYWIQIRGSDTVRVP